MNSTKVSKRILALDILRGVTIAGMIMVNNPGSWGHIYAPLRHAEWNGLTPTDLVFPFFMFIMGISTYISLKKYNFEFSHAAGMKILKKIDNQKSYPAGLRLLGAALIASCYCMIFGGNMIDFGIAFPAGMICYAFSRFLARYETNFFIQGFCCCMLSAFIAVFASATIPNASYEPIISGVLMIFVPGVAITNSIRDFLSGDMLSGLARMTEAVLTAISLAAGAGVVLKLWSYMGGAVL